MLHHLFFVAAPPPQIYTLSLHDALPIPSSRHVGRMSASGSRLHSEYSVWRSEEHTSELQSPMYLVCRLLLEKKNDESHNAHVHGHIFLQQLAGIAYNVDAVVVAANCLSS